MQFKYQLAILSLTALSVAQDLSSLPTCAQHGAASAIAASKCASTDIACICNSNSFISSLNSYAKANCSTDDYNQAVTAGQTICSAYGATISPSSTTTSDDTTPSSTTAADAVNEDDVDNASDASTSSNGTVTTTTPIASTTTMALDGMDMSSSTNGTLSLSTITRCSCQTEVVTLSASTTTSTPTAVATFTGAANPRGLTGDGFELLAGLIGIVGLMI